MVQKGLTGCSHVAMHSVYIVRTECDGCQVQQPNSKVSVGVGISNAPVHVLQAWHIIRHTPAQDT